MTAILVDPHNPLAAAQPGEADAGARPRGRLQSLDAFRGLAIAAMIFVNVAGAPVWPQLQHSAWNGLTIADLVFPAFLVAVGASLAVAKRPTPGRAIRRVVVLLALGLLVNRATFEGPWRYPGVLQRIAVCYIVAVLIVRLPRRFVALVTVLALIGYWAVLHIGGMTATHSFGGTTDVALFGQRHLYHQDRYDPEGLVSTIAATASVLLGYLVVTWVRAQPRRLRTAASLAAAACTLTAAGLAVGVVQAVNKRMWTPSFTLVTAGASLLVLAALYALIEVLRWRSLRLPLSIIGANALIIYALSELGNAGLRRISTPAGACARLPCPTIDGHDWIYRHWFVSAFGSRPGSLVFSAAAVAVLWLVAALLWRAKLLIRV